jgi:predicted CoA-substrate-specific enzyme activase
MSESNRVIAAIDVGTECVKALVMEEGVGIRGRAIVPTSGYFQHRVEEALDQALDEAGITRADLTAVTATGFAAECVPDTVSIAGETACHALGAWYHRKEAMSVIDIGGSDPKVMRIDEQGNIIDTKLVRRCAIGIGTFLMFTARHLDVHPTKLQELAAEAEIPAPIGSYCSVFSEVEILEQLRDGAKREDIAFGTMRSVAERIYEIGSLRDPVVVTGGVAEYFPGVLKSLSDLAGCPVEAVPEPIMTGALGAALKIL